MSVVLRTMLYVPSNSWRMINNATREMADAVILDLEDAVSLEEKETGRIFSRDSVGTLKEAGLDVYVRVNSTSSGLLKEDIPYVVVEGLDGIMLAKTETSEDIIDVDRQISEEEKKKGITQNLTGIIPLIENPLGAQNVFEITEASQRVVGVGFGAGDYLREMGVGFAITRLTAREYFPAILYARSRIANAANIAGIEAIDTPFFGLLIDTEGLVNEAESVKLLGFTGKQLVHPRHIEPVNRVFAPSEEDLEYAKKMVEVYEDAKAKGLGSASYQGRMIDYAMYKMGMDMLNKAERISEKEKMKPEDSLT